MNLYLLRHGIAAERGPRSAKDADRPLTPKGKRKLGQIAHAMKALDLSFDLILSSPYLRTRQTANLVVRTLKADTRLQFSDQLAPGGSVHRLVVGLAALDPALQNILLVGHEPLLTDLASLLITGRPNCSLVLKKGGLCLLTTASLKPARCAILTWLLTPKQMRLMVP